MTARFPKRAFLTLPLIGALALPLLSSGEPATREPVRENKYIGASKCKGCHNAESSGAQYAAWEKAKHSQAFELLASGAAAKEAAAERGIPDASKEEACLKCHVTGHGEPESAFARGFKQELGVQCETCHGPGQDHMKARFKAVAAGGTPEGYQGDAVEEMVVSPGVDVCVRCHNPESPSYAPFCYFEARGKIAHLNPQKPRSEEELAAYGKCPHGDGGPCPHAEGCPDGTCNLKPEALASMRR